MTPTAAVTFNPELLETYRIIRSTPSWKDVKDSMARLAPLREPAAKPYGQMDVDRDNVLRYAAILRNSADAITYGICLAAHLARFSREQVLEQRLNEGFQALSTGLDLPALAEAETRVELERCARAAFPDLKIELLPLLAPIPAPEPAPAPTAPVEAAPAEAAPGESVPVQTAPGSAAQSWARLEAANAPTPVAPPPPAPVAPAPPPPAPASDPWRNALENALKKIRDMDPLNIDEVIQRASDSWQARLQAFLLGRPEVLADIDYLRCRARNEPLGKILRARLKTASFRDWNEAYVAGMSETGVTFPLPLWFALAALGALGFEIPKDLGSVKSPDESKAANLFVSKIQQATSLKGLLILRVTAESQTAEWNISPTMPAVIMTPDEFLRPGKANLQAYFQARLHGVLIEVARDETPAAAFTRARASEISSRLSSVRIGYLMAAQPQNPQATSGNPYAVLPADAMAAYIQTFGATTK